MNDEGKDTLLQYRIVARILRRNGFRPILKSGSSHEKFVRDDGEHLVVRINGMNRMVWRRIGKDHKLIHVYGID